MYFDYYQYYRGCLIVSIFLVLFILCMLVPTVLYYTRVALRKCISLRDGMKCVLFVLICGFSLCMNVGILLHGGIYMLNEKETDAVEMQGYISDIRGLGRFAFPKLKSDYGYGETNGVEFTINGVQCTAIVKGSLEVGDYVSVVYLPKSGYVLFIAEVPVTIE